MEEYFFNNRNKRLGWFISHINHLLEQAEQNNNSNLVIYACFEMRNFLEQIEYSLVTLSLSQSEWELYKDDFAKTNGIDNVFNKIDKVNGKKIKESVDKYLSFNEVIMKAIEIPYFPISYKFTESQIFKNQLNKYCHLYTCNQSDFNFDSEFIKNGKTTINKCFQYLSISRVINENGITLPGIQIRTLKGSMKIVYDEWTSSQINSKEELLYKIKKINTDEHGGKNASYIGTSKDFRFGI